MSNSDNTDPKGLFTVVLAGNGKTTVPVDVHAISPIEAAKIVLSYSWVKDQNLMACCVQTRKSQNDSKK